MQGIGAWQGIRQGSGGTPREGERQVDVWARTLKFAPIPCWMFSVSIKGSDVLSLAFLLLLTAYNLGISLSELIHGNVLKNLISASERITQWCGTGLLPGE